MNTEEDIKQKKLMRKSRNKNQIIRISIFLILLSIWARIEYNNIKIKLDIVLEITRNDRIRSKNLIGKKIVFIADFQMDTRFNYNRKAVMNAINKVNKTDKDIILLGGDYKVGVIRFHYFMRT